MISGRGSELFTGLLHNDIFCPCFDLPGCEILKKEKKKEKKALPKESLRCQHISRLKLFPFINVGGLKGSLWLVTRDLSHDNVRLFNY
jgi:hypothetical protein